MRRVLLIGSSSLFAAVGFVGIGLGVYRIALGEVQHGLANLIVGGLVALNFLGIIREEL